MLAFWYKNGLGRIAVNVFTRTHLLTRIDARGFVYHQSTISPPSSFDPHTLFPLPWRVSE